MTKFFSYAVDSDGDVIFSVNYSSDSSDSNKNYTPVFVILKDELKETLFEIEKTITKIKRDERLND